MSRKVIFLMICLVWIAWGLLTLAKDITPVDDDKIYRKTGLALGAHCVSGRSANGIKFKVHYTGSVEAIDEYVSLPKGKECDRKLLVKFTDKDISLSFYENYILSVVIDNEILINSKNRIYKLNNRQKIDVYPLFVAIIATIALLFRLRHAVK